MEQGLGKSLAYTHPPEGEVMASTPYEPPPRGKKHSVAAALHTLEKNVQPLVAFWTKFTKDWSWNHAAGLAYNLILAVFPIVMTLLCLLGFFLSTLEPGAYQSTLDKITSSSSSLAEAKPIVAAALQQVRKDAGLLGVVSATDLIQPGTRQYPSLRSGWDTRGCDRLVSVVSGHLPGGAEPEDQLPPELAWGRRGSRAPGTLSRPLPPRGGACSRHLCRDVRSA
jgi:hypothetical protein